MRGLGDGDTCIKLQVRPGTTWSMGDNAHDFWAIQSNLS